MHEKMDEKIDVKIEDRKKEIEYLRLALGLAGIGVDYKIADLINRVVEKNTELGGKFSVKDGVNLQYGWEKDWQKYDEQQKLNEDAKHRKHIEDAKYRKLHELLRDEEL